MVRYAVGSFARIRHVWPPIPLDAGSRIAPRVMEPGRLTTSSIEAREVLPTSVIATALRRRSSPRSRSAREAIIDTLRSVGASSVFHVRPVEEAASPAKLAASSSTIAGGRVRDRNVLRTMPSIDNLLTSGRTPH